MNEYFYIIEVEDLDFGNVKEISGTICRDTVGEAYDFISSNNNPCLINNSNVSITVKSLSN